METVVDKIQKLEKDSATLMAMRERQKEYNKTYYAKQINKEKIRVRHDCECGLYYIGNNKKNHELGRVHKMWVSWKLANIKEIA